MDKKQIAVVIVVVIILIAAVSAIVATGGDKNKSSATLELLDENFSPILQVYGNVNEDLVIDEKDIEVLENALKNGTASSLRLADANRDGKVDQADVEYIKQIISATPDNPVVVKHLNRYTKGDYWQESKYPIDSMAISASANIIMMMKYAGINDKIKTVSYSGKIDSTMYSDYQYLFSDYGGKFDVNNTYKYRVGASAGFFSAELLTNHINEDKITAIITADNAGQYLAGSSSSHAYGITEAKAKELGLSVIRIAAASTDPASYLSDLALLTFMTKSDSSKIADLTTWYQNTIKDMNTVLRNNVGNGTEQVNFAVSSATSYSKSSDGKVTTYNYISSGTSDYTGAVLAAGGNFALKDYDFGTSTSSAKMTDLGKWLVDYKIDKLVVIKTGSSFSWYGGTALTDGLKTVQSCALAFSDTEAFYNNEVYVLSGDMPILLRTVYAACILYPDLFTKAWADNYNVQHCTQFLGIDENTVRSGSYYVLMADMGLSGH